MPGILVHSPARIIRQLLVDLGLGSLPATGGIQAQWSIFVDNEPASPNEVITVTDTTGITFRKDAYGNRNEHHGFQVKVRGGTHEIAWEKANAIANALDQVTDNELVTISAVEYCVASIKRPSPVIRMGPEPGSTRRLFSINALAYIKTLS